MEATSVSAAPLLCPQCHQVVSPTAYYCSNCGKKLHEPPFSTSAGAQLWIYAFSIILPIICFLAISYWPGIKYVRSDDPKVKQIGYIAIALVVISTIITFWYATVWINQQIQSSVSSIGSLG